MEVFIVKGLRVDFAEMRIVKELQEKQLNVECLELKQERRGEKRGSEDPPLEKQ